jgi:hypothetical protein
MLNHVHFQVRDLKAAIAWFQAVLERNRVSTTSALRLSRLAL